MILLRIQELLLERTKIQLLRAYDVSHLNAGEALGVRTINTRPLHLIENNSLRNFKQKLIPIGFYKCLTSGDMPVNLEALPFVSTQSRDETGLTLLHLHLSKNYRKVLLR